MLKLHQYPKNKRSHNYSPYCLKLETYLKMASIAYEIIPSSSPANAPKKKLPYIEDKGKVIADSNFIIHYLEAEYPNALDKELTASQRSTVRAYSRMLDEALGPAIMYSRWQDPEGWSKVYPVFFKRFPVWLGPLAGKQIRGTVVKQLYAQGVGRFSREEVYYAAAADLKALSTLLADNTYFLGETPSTLDASAFGHLKNILFDPTASPMAKTLMGIENLSKFVDRIDKKYF